MTDTFTCHDCGKVKPIKHNGGTGYGTYRDNPEAKVCYDCCGIRDTAQMVASGKATLYLTYDTARAALPVVPSSLQDGDRKVPVLTNWPGTLRIAARGVRRFRHPFTREAYLGEFTGPDGKLWRFKNIGDSQIAHCRRAAGA